LRQNQVRLLLLSRAAHSKGRFNSETEAGSVLTGSGQRHAFWSARNDALSGAAGKDTFAFVTGHGLDTITDFSAGAGIGDVIQLSVGTSFDTLAEVLAVAVQSGANTIITFDAANKITLTNVTKTALVADDFAFV
jgi:hypothetical protein